jgi:hypothetical protein
MSRLSRETLRHADATRQRTNVNETLFHVHIGEAALDALKLSADFFQATSASTPQGLVCLRRDARRRLPGAHQHILD